MRYHVCQFAGKTDNSDFLGLNLPKNGFRVGNSENYCWNENHHPRDTICGNFLAKRTTLTFSAQIPPKMDFLVILSKIKVWIRNQHLQDIMCANFQSKWITLNFSAETWRNCPNCPITCDNLVLVMSRVLQGAGWWLKWARKSWLEMGAWFSNTHY